MSKIEAYYPAFPIPASSVDDSRLTGISLRDYLAAHAPERPGDYNPRGYPEYPEYPSIDSGLTGDARNAASEAAAHEWLRLSEEHSAAVLAFILSREVSWRYAYADAMLKAREATP